MDRRTALKVCGISIAVPVIEGVSAEIIAVPAKGVAAEVNEHTGTPLLVVLRHPHGTAMIDDKEVSVREIAIEVAEAAAIAINTGHKVAAVTLPPGYGIEVIEHPQGAKWVTPSDMVCVLSVNRRE